eukprot:m.417561 g.417561  ORF g.417561 m.417561 type:complete len:988 (-) comp30501_c0_seq1:236-3199(-)
MTDAPRSAAVTMASSLQPGALSCSAGFDALFAAIDASCGQLPTTQQQPAPPPQSQSAAGWSVSAPAVSGGSTGAAVAAASPKLPHAGVFTSWPPGAATAGGVGGIAAVQPFGSASPPSQPWGLVSGRGNTGSSRGNESGSDSNTLGELGAMSASRSAAVPDHGHPSPSPRHRLSRRADTEEEHEEAGWSSSGGWSTSASADADLGDAEASSRTSLLPLASVPVPPLDNKHLPPALRQIADHNPRGLVEGEIAGRGRRKRKAVRMEGFVSEVPVVRQRVRGGGGKQPEAVRKNKRSSEKAEGSSSPHDLTRPQAPTKPSPPCSPAMAEPSDGNLSAPTGTALPPPTFVVPARHADESTEPASMDVDAPATELETAELSSAPIQTEIVDLKEPTVKREDGPRAAAASPISLPAGDLFDLPHGASKEDLPTELRRLLDHNGKGAAEVVVLGPRKRKPTKPFVMADEPTTTTAAAPKRPSAPKPVTQKMLGETKSGSAPREASPKAPSVDPSPLKRARAMSSPKQKSTKPAAAVADVAMDEMDVKSLPLEMRRLLDFNNKGLVEVGLKKRGDVDQPPTQAEGPDSPRPPSVPITAPAPPEVVAAPPSLPRFTSVALAEEPMSHKVWLMLSPESHRRFVKLMGGQYRYKQHAPTPTFLRAHGFEFSVHVQQEGEFIATVGWSHIVLSGNSRGFSWSQLDPSTVERLEHSDSRHGSRQADGKPNSFSAHFARSDVLMAKLKHTLKCSEKWEHTEADIRRYVRNTKTDISARKARETEGWHAAEIRPVYLPTVAQLEDPKWFTAMMSGPGKEHGSLHIRFPPNWRRSADRNHGHVSWGPVPRVWKLEVSERESHFAAAEGAEAAETIVSVKVVRPESKGYDAKQAVHQLSIQVPTSPAEISDFIHELPAIAKRMPLFYGPQTIVTEEQKEQLARVMPSWALPESEIDGMRNAFSKPAEGTTTPSAFGGQFGVTGLHDEYNHTVSIFVYPWATNL